jgi:hypothetical protein
MTRTLLAAGSLVATLALLACGAAPGGVCKDATGTSIENPDYCRLYPARSARA